MKKAADDRLELFNRLTVAQKYLEVVNSFGNTNFFVDKRPRGPPLYTDRL